ncbi:hypothetical protein NM10_06058 [Megasphaera sp. NM10]|nr:hypothetical protein NM10_06058 [Megasphaera sp. NM10]
MAGTDGIGLFIREALDLGLGIKIIERARSLDERLPGKDTAGLIGKKKSAPGLFFFVKNSPCPSTRTAPRQPARQ